LVRAVRGGQLAVGVACAIIGAEALFVPSRFTQVLLPIGTFGASIPLLSSAFVAVGACLCAIGVLDVRRRLVLAGWLCAGLLLFVMSALRLTAQAWLDGALYACAGMFIGVSAFVPASLAATRPNAGPRLGPVLGVARMLIGAALIGLGLATSAGRHDWATTA